MSRYPLLGGHQKRGGNFVMGEDVGLRGGAFIVFVFLLLSRLGSLSGLGEMIINSKTMACLLA